MHQLRRRTCCYLTFMPCMETKEIVTIKYRESLSFPEARKIVDSRQTLYSTITKTHTSTARQVKDAFTETVDVGVQTETQKKPETNCMPQKQTPSNVKPPQKPLVNKHAEKPYKSALKSPSKSPRQVLSDRLPKGSDDQIQQHNRFHCLDEEDMEADVNHAEPLNPNKQGCIIKSNNKK